MQGPIQVLLFTLRDVNLSISLRFLLSISNSNLSIKSAPKIYPQRSAIREVQENDRRSSRSSVKCLVPQVRMTEKLAAYRITLPSGTHLFKFAEETGNTEALPFFHANAD
ncbi:hypothetical protein AVEN_160791-1 [Araneus ventricosus]|uniref:Uncharacterized protein n=1 Tax=Araneus ventricosus TaxID=182803 RepID=A0A4Y2QE47_ARAVE|nr:hypothetical protein AVEN_160791-1 [Araneus ventricosus]